MRCLLRSISVAQTKGIAVQLTSHACAHHCLMSYNLAHIHILPIGIKSAMMLSLFNKVANSFDCHQQIILNKSVTVVHVLYSDS